MTTERQSMGGEVIVLEPLPCPFCGGVPEIEPFNWKQSGDAWGRVACRNPKCAAEPKIETHLDDVEGVSGDANSKRCKEAAIAKWNLRAPATQRTGEGR